MFSTNLKRLRKQKGLSINGLGRLVNLSPSYLSSLERGVKTNPSFSTIEKLAEVLNVSLDYLTGDSASALIENQLEKIGMSLQELSEKSGVPLTFLNYLDNIIPDEIDYQHVKKIAATLGLSSGALHTALARQEPPAYDGPQSSPEEDFAEVDFSTDQSIPSWATSKDKCDFKKMLENDVPIMFDGVPIEGPDRQRVLDVLTGLFWEAKEMNKKTYGRKKTKNTNLEDNEK